MKINSITLSNNENNSKSVILITSLPVKLSLCFRLVFRTRSIAAYPLWFAVKKYRLFPKKEQIFPDLKIVKKWLDVMHKSIYTAICILLI